MGAGFDRDGVGAAAGAAVTRCNACQTDHHSPLPLATSPSVPSGVVVEGDMIAVWLRCPCGEVLVELYSLRTGARVEADDEAQMVGEVLRAYATDGDWR